MSLALVLSFSVISHLPRSLSSSSLKVSFFGTATVWQYWQFLAGNPASFACLSMGGVAWAGSVIPHSRVTAVIPTSLDLVIGRASLFGASSSRRESSASSRSLEPNTSTQIKPCRSHRPAPVYGDALDSPIVLLH